MPLHKVDALCCSELWQECWGLPDGQAARPEDCFSGFPCPVKASSCGAAPAHQAMPPSAATARTVPYMQGWRDGCSWPPALCSPAWHHHHCARPVLQHAHPPQGEPGGRGGLLRNCAPAPDLTPRHVPSASSSSSAIPADSKADVGVQVHVLSARHLTAKQACKSSLTVGAAL